MSARARRRRRRRWPAIVLGVAVLAIVFLLGVALGLTLEERPQTGKMRTSVRTFRPPEVPPPTTNTVTIP